MTAFRTGKVLPEVPLEDVVFDPPPPPPQALTTSASTAATTAAIATDLPRFVLTSLTPPG